MTGPAGPTYRSVNRAGWDELNEQRTGAMRSYGPQDFARARELLDPAGWLPWRRLRTVLCLAAGGGQQGPLFASLGYEVTVADLSPEQLAKDHATARQYSLNGERRSLARWRPTNGSRARKTRCGRAASTRRVASRLTPDGP